MLISGNLLYAAYYAKLSHIKSCTVELKLKKDIKTRNWKWERSPSIHRTYDAEHVWMFEGAGDWGGSAHPTVNTWSHFPLGAEGVASFICLHNCRPACLFVWHLLVRSTALLLHRQRKRGKCSSPLPASRLHTGLDSSQTQRWNPFKYMLSLRHWRAVSYWWLWLWFKAFTFNPSSQCISGGH